MQTNFYYRKSLGDPLPSYLVTVTGEMPLRSSRTRPRFYKVLVENIIDALRRNGIRILSKRLVNAKIFIETDRDALEIITRVFGVYKAGKVLVFQFKDIDDLSSWVYEKARNMVLGKKFAVRVKRSGKHTFTSIDIARKVGALLKPHSAGVDLENFDVLIELEVRDSKIFLYEKKMEGPGGLPMGVEGKGLVLFSGGFDSPVAAWFSAKRGILVDFLHFIMGSIRPSYFAFIVAKNLASNWFFGYTPRFIVMDFRSIVTEVVKKVDWSYRQVALRALMYLVASKVASQLDYDVIITGESIGQASSQTLKNISAIERAVKPEVPILRPLLGFDKEEIIDYSRKIGLYELSSKVAEACVIAPHRVVTTSSPEEVLSQVQRIDLSIVDRAISNIRILDLLGSKPEDVIAPDEVEIDFIPSGAIILDLRSEIERMEKPIPGALPYHEIEPEKLPRDSVLVLVCETGNVSYMMAKMLRDLGIKAYSLKGGTKGFSSG